MSEMSMETVSQVSAYERGQEYIRSLRQKATEANFNALELSGGSALSIIAGTLLSHSNLPHGEVLGFVGLGISALLMGGAVYKFGYADAMENTATGLESGEYDQK